MIEDCTSMNGALCWECNITIYLFIYSAKLWAGKVGRPCTTEDAQWLKYRFLCQAHFLPTDFVTPEGIRLNRSAVPHGLDSASHSITQSSPPFLCTLQCIPLHHKMCGCGGMISYILTVCWFLITLPLRGVEIILQSTIHLLCWWIV